MSKKSPSSQSFKPLNRDFYTKNASNVAYCLLGKIMVHESSEGITAGIIVETEAYHSNDPASHAFGGKTKRNEVMFGEAGHAYIYFIYGVHYCVNAVTGKEGIGEGVLIRALEPIQGIDLMKKRRGIADEKKLTNGPAKLVAAMGITNSMLGTDLTENTLFIADAGKTYMESDVVTTTRVGITKGADSLLRFYIKNNPFVSKR